MNPRTTVLRRITTRRPMLRHAADRLTTGHRTTLRRITASAAAWVRDAPPPTGATALQRIPWARIGRLTLLLIGAYLAWRAIRAWPWLMWPLTAYWAATAWRAGRPPAPAAAAGGQDQAADPGEHAPTVPAGPQVDPLLQLCAELIGTGRGVHLAQVAERLHAAGAHPHWGVGEIASALEARGVRVRPSVKVSGRVRKGVHLDDLQAALTHSPQDAADPSPEEVAQTTTTTLTRDDYPTTTRPATPATTPH